MKKLAKHQLINNALATDAHKQLPGYLAWAFDMETATILNRHASAVQKLGQDPTPGAPLSLEDLLPEELDRLRLIMEDTTDQLVDRGFWLVVEGKMLCPIDNRGLLAKVKDYLMYRIFGIKAKPYLRVLWRLQRTPVDTLVELQVELLAAQVHVDH